MQRFGEKVRRLRKARRITLQALAAALGHADHSYLSKVETGKKQPSTELILLLAQYFEVSVDQLVFDDRDINE